ncbi:glucose-6-phosphate isomerase [Pelagibacteraceae bacterium]|nr:glucose-6-phosphate isomerase [Pelagibacteraceae bacterium]
MKKKLKNFLLKNYIKKNFIKNNLYSKNTRKLNKIIKDVYKNLDKNKDTFHILSKNFILDIDEAKLKKYKKYKSIVLIGMGGSVLGSNAIYSFLKERISKNFIFLDNLDQLKIEQTIKKVNLKTNLFIIISKSGNTIETLVNSNLLKNRISYKNTIIITEQKKNLLNEFARSRKILQIYHKNYIGGRYSVLSEVGMIPAYFMGLKVSNFRKNLLSFFKTKKNLIYLDSVVMLADIYSSKKINSIIFLNYTPQLNKFLFWCQQLMAESLGKNGKGILPIVSSNPRDHHSLMQLYLDGPKDKLFYIFSLNLDKKIKTNANIFGKKFKFAENKKLSEIIESQKKALIKVFKKKKIPFREFKINKINEEVLGELFSYFMFETALVGKLININPFNQPAVEEIKILTKQYLS